MYMYMCICTCLQLGSDEATVMYALGKWQKPERGNVTRLQCCRAVLYCFLPPHTISLLCKHVKIAFLPRSAWLYMYIVYMYICRLECFLWYIYSMSLWRPQSLLGCIRGNIALIFHSQGHQQIMMIEGRAFAQKHLILDLALSICLKVLFKT